MRWHVCGVTAIAFVACSAASGEEVGLPIQVEPQRHHVLDISIEEWRRRTNRLCPDLTEGSMRSPSHGAHLLRLCRADSSMSAGREGMVEQIIEVLSSATKSEKLFGKSILLETRHGVRHRPLAVHRAASGRADESHPHLVLSAFAEQGVPLSAALKFDGRRRCVSDMVSDTLLNYSDKVDQIEWTGLALCLYGKAQWVNKYGERSSLSAIAGRLCEVPPSRRSCYGTHVFYTLAIIARADAKVSLLSAPVRSAVWQRIRSWRSIACETQHADGYWGRKWYDREQRVPEAGLVSRFVATGHLAEALLYLPEEIDVDKGVLRRAGTWLWSQMGKMGDLNSRFQMLCPGTHAACVVRLLMSES